jgi:hypothetical protein
VLIGGYREKKLDIINEIKTAQEWTKTNLVTLDVQVEKRVGVKYLREIRLLDKIYPAVRGQNRMWTKAHADKIAFVQNRKGNEMIVNSSGSKVVVNLT